MMKTSIVLADDHKIIVDGLRSLLNSHQQYHVVATAHDGKELLKKVEMHQPDLVISDIEMPIMNGFEAAERIKSRFANIRIIILSMYREPSLIRKLIEMGIDGYLIKTSDQNELITGIDKVIKGQKYFDGEVTVALTQPDPEPAQNRRDREKIDSLSSRELEIVKHICDGLSNKEIGEKLFISHRTVDTHRTNVMRKLEVHSVVELIKLAIKSGVIDQ